MAHISIEEARSRLEEAKEKFTTLFQHGSLEVEIYQPDKVDLQTPHTRDEVYVIISGHGRFLNGNTKVQFGPGDFLFVKAGVDHRFLEFSDDFCTWVLFYGPVGGEHTEGS